MLDFRTSKSNSEVLKSYSKILVENYVFLKNYVTSEGAVSHNVLYYQQLSIACYQVRFYAYNYFELLPIVSSCRFHQTLPNLGLILGLKTGSVPYPNT